MKAVAKDRGVAAPRGRQTREAYLHLLTQSHDTKSLAKALGVSLPTAARIIVALRLDLGRKGMRLVSVREESGFHYEIRDEALKDRLERDPFVNGVIRGRAAGGKSLKPEDEDIYGRD